MPDFVLSDRRLFLRDILVNGISDRSSQTSGLIGRSCKTVLFLLSIAVPALFPVNTANPYYLILFVRTAECIPRAPPRARAPRRWTAARPVLLSFAAFSNKTSRHEVCAKHGGVL